jgi:hypothetical protein
MFADHFAVFCDLLLKAFSRPFLRKEGLSDQILYASFSWFFVLSAVQLSPVDSLLGPNIGFTICFLLLLLGFPKYLERIRAPQRYVLRIRVKRF